MSQITTIRLNKHYRQARRAAPELDPATGDKELVQVRMCVDDGKMHFCDPSSDISILAGASS